MVTVTVSVGVLCVCVKRNAHAMRPCEDRMDKFDGWKIAATHKFNRPLFTLTLSFAPEWTVWYMRRPNCHWLKMAVCVWVSDTHWVCDNFQMRQLGFSNSFFISNSLNSSQVWNCIDAVWKTAARKCNSILNQFQRIRSVLCAYAWTLNHCVI